MNRSVSFKQFGKYGHSKYQVFDSNYTCATYGVAIAPNRASAEHPPTPTDRNDVG